MIYLKVFPKHTSYESELNVGGEDFEIPNVSYCDDADDIHYNPYNTVEFYVGEITEPQTVKIYTDTTNFDEVIVSEGNKWYSYLLPKDKGLYKIEGDSVKKVNVKADINTYGNIIIPTSTVEASFKGSDTSKAYNIYKMFRNCSGLISLDVSSFDTSNQDNLNLMFENCAKLESLDLSSFNTSKVNDMTEMFNGCAALTSLDLSGWNMSNVTDTNQMFDGCASLTTIRMVGCGQSTIQKITDVKPSGATIVTGQTI